MKHEHHHELRERRARLARALLSRLAGRSTSSDGGTPDAELPSLAEARELRAWDLEAAREVALVHSHYESLPGRVRAAISRDRAPVLLRDGSRLTLDDAERTLAKKEERRAFLPLRRALEEAAAAADESFARAHERFDDVLGEVLVGPHEQLASAPPSHAGSSVPSAAAPDGADIEAAAQTLSAADVALSWLARFLRDVKDAALAAREALAHDGHQPLEDPASFARGLDLPDPEGFSEEAVRRLGRALSSAAGQHQRRALKAVRAPRALAGVVLSAELGPVRVAACPSSRAARFLSLSGALGGGVALTLSDADALAPRGEDELLVFGAALSLGAGAAVVRRGVLEEPSAEAERRGRVLAATRLLRVEAAAHAARVRLSGEGREALRETLAGTLGVDPPVELLDTLTAPPWPGLVHLRGPAASVGADVVRLAMGAALASALRDRYDEAFPLVPSPYELFGAARGALAEGAVTALELSGAPFDVEHPGRALVEWTAELL